MEGDKKRDKTKVNILSLIIECNIVNKVGSVCRMLLQITYQDKATQTENENTMEEILKAI